MMQQASKELTYRHALPLSALLGVRNAAAQAQGIPAQGPQNHLHELQVILVCGLLRVGLCRADLLRPRSVHYLHQTTASKLMAQN